MCTHSSSEGTCICYARTVAVPLTNRAIVIPESSVMHTSSDESEDESSEVLPTSTADESRPTGSSSLTDSPSPTSTQVQGGQSAASDSSSEISESSEEVADASGTLLPAPSLCHLCRVAHLLWLRQYPTLQPASLRSLKSKLHRLAAMRQLWRLAYLQSLLIADHVLYK